MPLSSMALRIVVTGGRGQLGRALCARLADANDVVAVACRRADAALLYISTNEVFDGERGEAYTEFDATNPINAYGRSKLAGERAVSAMLDRCYIVRTAWLFGDADNTFPTRILRRARETDVLRV